MIPYLDCQQPDQSRITLEIFRNAEDIPYLVQNNAVAIHQHKFYEMVLILRGSCQHFYRGLNIPLIPGDLFLVPPDQPHSYRFHENISLCNCQFYRDALGPTPENFLQTLNMYPCSRRTLRASV